MAAGDFLAPRGMGEAQGKKVDPSAIAVQAIEAQPTFGQIEPMRGPVLACVEQHLGDVPVSDRPTQEAPIPGEQTETLACRKGRHLSPRGQNPTQAPRRTGSSSVEEIARLNRNVSSTATSLSC